VSIFSFANQRREEELAEYVSFLQTPSQTLYQYQLPTI